MLDETKLRNAARWYITTIIPLLDNEQLEAIETAARVELRERDIKKQHNAYTLDQQHSHEDEGWTCL